MHFRCEVSPLREARNSPSDCLQQHLHRFIKLVPSHRYHLCAALRLRSATWKNIYSVWHQTPQQGRQVWFGPRPSRTSALFTSLRRKVFAEGWTATAEDGSLKASEAAVLPGVYHTETVSALCKHTGGRGLTKHFQHVSHMNTFSSHCSPTTPGGRGECANMGKKIIWRFIPLQLPSGPDWGAQTEVKTGWKVSRNQTYILLLRASMGRP